MIKVTSRGHQLLMSSKLLLYAIEEEEISFPPLYRNPLQKLDLYVLRRRLRRPH